VPVGKRAFVCGKRFRPQRAKPMRLSDSTFLHDGESAVGDESAAAVSLPDASAIRFAW
jgi:hypothetical protein